MMASEGYGKGRHAAIESKEGPGHCPDRGTLSCHVKNTLQSEFVGQKPHFHLVCKQKQIVRVQGVCPERVERSRTRGEMD